MVLPPLSQDIAIWATSHLSNFLCCSANEKLTQGPTSQPAAVALGLSGILPERLHNKRRRALNARLQRFVASFTGADSHNCIYRGDPDLAVADLLGASRVDKSVDQIVDFFVFR